MGGAFLLLLAIFFVAGYAIGRMAGYRDGYRRALEERSGDEKVIDIRPRSDRSAE